MIIKLLFTMENATTAGSSQSNISRLEKTTNKTILQLHLIDHNVKNDHIY